MHADDDADNRPTSFQQGDRRIDSVYDFMGRRIEKATWEKTTLMKRLRSIYHGYVQIAEIDATDETTPYVAKTYRWDPSEPVATRPLALSLWTREGTARETLYYAHDLRKNVVSLFDAKGLRRASYQYDPYGNITSMEGDMARENPYRYSSEHHDEDIGLVYYNYRHYNPTDGRWTSRDPIAEKGGWNLYGFIENCPVSFVDLLGTALVPSTMGPITAIGPYSITFIPEYIETLTWHGGLGGQEIGVSNRTFIIGKWEKDGERQGLQITRHPVNRNQCMCTTWKETAEYRFWAQAMTYFRYKMTDNAPSGKTPLELVIEEAEGLLPPIASLTLLLLTTLQRKKFTENKHSLRVWGDEQWKLLAKERKWTIVPGSDKTTTGPCPSSMPPNEDFVRFPEESTGFIELFLGEVPFMIWRNEKEKARLFERVNLPYYQ